jgi:cell division protein FtsI (penicillin-binding protein 3)
MTIEHLVSYQPTVLRWRRRIVLSAMALVAVAIVARLIDIQIIERSRWQALADQQYRAHIQISGERGKICDRNGTILATAIPTISFALDPKMARSPERIALALERIGVGSASEMLRRVRSAMDRNFVWLVRNVPLETASVLDTLDDPGLIRLRELQRAYVLDSVASQVVGTTDVDGRGIAGIELQYDSLLRGTSGMRIMERIGRGRLRPSLGEPGTAAQPGATIELTLDADLQQIAEQELARSVRTTGASAGIVIAIDPTTGEVLACAHQPAYSPTRRTDADALRLRAVTDMYEPGSTFKPIVAAALLAEGRSSPERMVDGHGGSLQTADGRIIRDHEPLGWCTLTDALVHSSNIVFAELAQQLGARTLYRYARDFGFGIRTDIELPGEARGVLRMPRLLDRGDLMFIGFGYGIACTPLQLANAYATIANDGVLMKPYVVRRIIGNDGTIVSESKPQRIRRVVSRQVAEQLRSMLEQVVERGTGINARIDGLAIAGKTGTAQQWIEGSYSKRDYTASFVAMVPARAPRMVILAMLDRPRSDIYGGSTAAPLVRRIVEAVIGTPHLALRYGLVGVLSGSTLQRDSIAVPDMRGFSIAQAHALARTASLELGATARVNPTHVVTGQEPMPGAFVPRGTRVVLSTADPDTLRTLPLVGLPLRNACALAAHIGATVHIHGQGQIRRYTIQRTDSGIHLLLSCR